MFFFDDIARWLRSPEESEGGSGEIGSKVLEAFPLPLLVCDKGLSILKANSAFTRHFKVTEGEIKGKTALQILGTETKIIEEEGAGKEKQVSGLGDLVGGVKILEGHFPKLGRRVFRLHARKAPPIVLLALEEITKTRELEETIRKSRRELLSVFDGIDDPTVMIDRNFRIRRINAAMLQALGGRSYQDFIGRACYYKLHRLREACPGCTAGKTFKTGKRTSSIGPIRGKTGPEESLYQITCHPIRDPTGKAVAIAESYRDITQVKRTEEQLYESERSRVMEPIAAGIAHEIRNPLAIIRSSAQYCLGGAEGKRDLEEGLQTILKSADTANRVITDFLDFSRPHGYDFKMQPLSPILHEAIRLIGGRAKGQRVRIRREIATHLPQLRLDRKRFLQAIMNFLINSLDAMPRGGELGVLCHPARSGRKVELAIRDTGTGIPEEMVSKVFQPFFSTKKNGIGLGLPIAEGILRTHGGRVTFHSWAGRGSEVRVELPLRGAGS